MNRGDPIQAVEGQGNDLIVIKHKWRFLFGGLAGALVAAAWWLYNRRA